jgi:DNA-binding transcriptional MocR family regulator
LRFIRAETRARQKLVSDILPKDSYRHDPLSFNVWVPIPKTWTRAAFVEHMKPTGLGVVASDAFVAGGRIPEAVRLCIGGPKTRTQIKNDLEYLAHALLKTPAMASAFL